jgi:hypothetical protein
MITSSIKERILMGFTYEEYSALILSKIEELNEKSTEAKTSGKFELLRLNSARSRRIDKTFSPGNEIISLMSSLSDNQTWMMLTEPWCGDSAQNIPFIAKIASLNPKIEFRLLLRDQNPDIMDQYLTNGARSIPILVAFDEEWNEVFRWGSRPKTAVDLVSDLKNSGMDKKQIDEKLHSWYALNKGKDLISEICEILRTQLTPEML